MASIDNLQEAQRAAQLAKDSFLSGYYERAQKMIEKSLRLHPTEEARKLSQAIKLKIKQTQQQQQQTQEEVKKGESEQKKTKEDEKSSFTKEQLEAVAKIKNSRSFYQVLGVAPGVDEVELKKAYRKLALAFHPDKNQAPGAEDAFKLISLAYDTLGNGAKRRMYDIRGGSGLTEDGTDRPPADPDLPEKYQVDKLPEDEVLALFKELSELHDKAAEENRRKQKNQKNPNQSTAYEDPNRLLYVVVQVLPIFFIYFVVYICSISTNYPRVSFELTKEFPIEVKGNTREFAYFVPSDYDIPTDSRSVYYIEKSLRDKYAEHLKGKCHNDKQLFGQSNRKGPAIGASQIESQIPSCVQYEKWIHGK